MGDTNMVQLPDDSLTERNEMRHPKQTGRANVLTVHISEWEAKGWLKVTPVRGDASAKTRTKQDAKTRDKGTEK